MKEHINKIYNMIINYIIEFFHMAQNKFKKLFIKINKKLYKFYTYEILGVVFISIYVYRLFDKIYKFKYFVKFRKTISKIIKYIKIKAKIYFMKYKATLEKANFHNNIKIDYYKKKYSKYMTPNILAKGSLLVVLTIFIIFDAYSWFYSEYESRGTRITLGTVEHEVTHYDSNGDIVGTVGDTITVIEEDDLSNTYKNTQYIVIKNTGSLDLDYNLTFTLDGTVSNAGILYYRVSDITDEVMAQTVTSSNPTKLKAYAANNPTPANLETDATNPVSNLTTIPQLVIQGEIDKDENDDENNYRYFRVDYGVYQTITSSLYSGASVAVHANVYCTQRGIDYSLSSEGEVWLVENEDQFRDAVLNALSGDTIKLADNIKIDGSVDIGRRIHLDTDEYDLHITGDLVYDFVEIGTLSIDTSGGGKLDVDQNLYINAPKSQIHIVGLNDDYDIYVGEDFTVNGIQNEEDDGVLLEGVRIVQNKVGNIPVDVIVMSNTRLTIAPNVQVGYVIAANNSTNIEILNNGIITQVQLQNMNLIDSFSKYQIYIYNLDTILGVLGGSSIVLPDDSTPYTGPNSGNTLIIRGVSSNDITVSGSDHYTSSDINDGSPEDSVIPIQGESDSYYVYIRANSESLEGLLEAYFAEHSPNNISQKISDIKKLIIYTVNTSYFENEDFDYVASSAMPSIQYLGLANATISDGNTINKIANNTLKDKSSLRTVILSKTLTNIGDNAFQNVNLGRIPTTGAFTFLTIPSTVTNIGDNAFQNTRYVYFEGQNPPTVGSGAFNSSSTGTKFFVPAGAIEEYRDTTNIDEKYVYYQADLSDNKLYFVYNTSDGYGISYFINNVTVGSTLTIPNTLTLNSITKNVTEIGYNAYRNLNTPSGGTEIILPNTVDLIDSYAFYSDDITSINLDYVETINKYAFANTSLTRLETESLRTIGNYAFKNVPLTYVSLEYVESIGSHAFEDNTTLYEVNMGTVKNIGAYAFYNCPNIGRVWFKNTSTVVKNNAEEIDLTVGENAVFTNWGMYLDGRLRVYVPTGSSSTGLEYLAGYKKLFGSNESYIYPTGTIIGSYHHVAIPYDWGEYSVKSVTKNNAQGQSVTAYEIIEYHGADLTSTYQLPDVLVLDDSEIVASITGNYTANSGSYRYSGTLKIQNNTTDPISDWTVRLSVPEGVTWGSTNGAARESFDSESRILTLQNSTSNGTIASGASGSVSFYFDTSSQNLNLDILSAYSSSIPTMEIISIGEYAYRHTTSASGNTIDLVANNLLNIDNHGLENISVSSLSSSSLVSIGDYGLYNTGLETVNLPNLNSLGEYAMSGMDTLYSVNLGNIQVMGDNAISNNPNLEQVFIGTTNTDNMSISSTAMSRIGTNAHDRLRIYVPSNKVDFYKAEFSTYSDYIFPTGYIVGSYVNTPIPYDIGEYSVREVTLNNRNGESVTGWEIIEYHGADLSNTFTIPTSYTANGVTHDVISIGDYAYKHATVTGSGSDIVNNTIMSIGGHAFEDKTAIKTFKSNSLLDLGEYAFNNSGLVSFEAPNLRKIESYALSNMTTLYRIDFGGVYEMQSNAVYNTPNLLQVFFTPSDDTRTFDRYAFTSVGQSTNDRIRFYVRQSDIVTEITNTNTANISITNSCSSNGYTGSGLNRRYRYNCTATVNNNSGQDIVSWTGKLTANNVAIDTSVTVNGAIYENGTNQITFSNTATNGSLAAGNTLTFTYSMRTTSFSSWTAPTSLTEAKGTYYTYTQSTSHDYLTSTYANSFRDEYVDYFYDYDGHIVGTYTSSTITNDIGEYSVVLREKELSDGDTITGWEIVEYHGANLDSSYIIPTSLTLDGETHDVIGVGERAYEWATASSGAALTLNSSALRYVGDYAFYDLNAIREINLPNIDSIGERAFFGNKLYKVSIAGCHEIGDYSFANNPTLNYVYAGDVERIGAGAFYGCTGIEQMFFTSTNANSSSSTMKISIGDNAFYNVGTTIGKRLRVYVPDGNASTNVTYQTAYKNTFPENIATYIYPTGELIGSFTYGSLPYNIQEYSVREVTKQNISGSNVTGWEIIEYHGPDITSSFEIPESITVDGETKNVISIGSYAYYEFPVATGVNWELTIPSSVVEIGDYAFYNTDVTRVTGNQLRRLGKYSFAECDNLTNFIFNSVVNADAYCLYSCDKISVIQFGSGTTNIGDYALWNPYENGPNTTLIMQVTSVPTTAVTALPDYDEISILGLTLGYNSHFTYSVPSNVRSTFNGTTPWRYHNASTANFDSDFLFILNNNEIQITGYTGTTANLTIPNTLTVSGRSYNVTSIAANAFDSAQSTTAITLPANMNTIDDGFLENNEYISNIYVNASNTTFSSTNGVLFDISNKILIRYPNGKNSYTYTVPETVTTIAYRAFTNQTYLTTINMSSNLKTIGAYAFKGCTSLDNYYFNSDVPYLTAFGTFEENTGMRLYVPNAYLSNYQNDFYFKKYSTYLTGN